MLSMTYLDKSKLSNIFNAAALMDHLAIQSSPDDSSAGPQVFFHKKTLLFIRKIVVAAAVKL